MKSILDAEFHPVIEDFISEYVDGEMGAVERNAFEELMVFDDGIREFTFAARTGKQLLSRYRRSENGRKLIKRLQK